MNPPANNNKRKGSWKAPGRDRGYAKRFHGSNDFSKAEYQRGRHSRWGQAPESHREFSSPRHSSNHQWRPYSGDRYHVSRLGPDQHQTFPLQKLGDSSLISTELLKEQEDHHQVGPGSETERMEKVLATKRRIEEALASKLSDNSQDITLQNSSKEANKDKSSEARLPNVGSLDLRLTNSDFKEIGSVQSAVVAEGENEGNDLILNVAPCSSQQRSFDTTVPTSSTFASKSPRVSGWTMSAINEIAVSTELAPSRPGGERYIQEVREEILGDVQPASERQNIDSPASKPVSPKHHSRNDFSRVGQLYHSFLRSRLSGCFLKTRSEVKKPTGPNPLLNKSVLENQNSKEISIESNNIMELQMPLPIQIKREARNTNNAEITPEEIAAEEASEFCKDFSFLLKHPNYLIPPEDLEKLGLGHLSEMNELVNESRNILENSPGQQESCLRVRSLNTLNNITGHDITYNELTQANQESSFSPRGVSSSFSGLQESQSCSARVLSPKVSNQQSSTLEGQDVLSQNKQASERQNVSVESLVEKVVEKLFNSSGISSKIPHDTQSSNEQLNFMASQNEATSGPKRNSASGTQPSLTQLQNISSKVLRLFLIDKQIEGLMQEKIKIYSELLSAKEISSTLFNSWAQDQIQQGNVMNVLSNTSHSVPELARIIKTSFQEQKSQNSNDLSFFGDSLQETVSSLFSVKNEEVHTRPSLESMRVEPSLPVNVEPPNSNVSTPNCDRPKLSVRKDLLDPNIPMTAELDHPNKLLHVDSGEIETPWLIDPNKKIKKSKTRNETGLETVNLIDETSDDESCSISLDSGATGNDPLPVNHLDNSGPTAKSSNNKKKPKRFDLGGLNATCMTVMNKAIIVGSKEGYLSIFDVGTGKIVFLTKVHSDAVTCLETHKSFVISGSADSTLNIFTVQDLRVLQTIQVNSRIQCLDSRFGKVFIGTRKGFLFVYNIFQPTNLTNDGVEALENLSSQALTLEQEPLRLTESSIVAIRSVKIMDNIALILASRGDQITIRDATSGSVIRSFEWCDTVNCLELLSPLVFCGTDTKSVKAVNFHTGETVHDYPMGRAANHIVIVNQILFVVCKNGKLYTYNLKEDKLINIVEIGKGILSICVTRKKIIYLNKRKQLKAVILSGKLKKLMKKKT